MRVLPLSGDIRGEDIIVELDGAEYRIRTRYQRRDDSWYLDVGTPSTWLVEGRRITLMSILVDGITSPDLFGGGLVAIDRSGRREEPGKDDLGDRVVLVYLPRGAS